MSNFKAFESYCNSSSSSSSSSFPVPVGNCILFITYIFITLLFFYFKYWLIEGKQRLIIVNVVIVIGGKTFNWKNCKQSVKNPACQSHLSSLHHGAHKAFNVSLQCERSCDLSHCSCTVWISPQVRCMDFKIF